MAATSKVAPTDQQEWEAKLTQVARDADKAQWEIGDLILEADSEWGDMYTRAMEITGKPTKTLKNYVTVCKKFERSRRRDESDHLRFGHFAAVAGLDEPQQEKFLAKADKERWSVDLIRLKVSELRKGSDSDPKDRVVVMVPRGLYPKFIDAAQARSESEHEMKKPRSRDALSRLRPSRLGPRGTSSP